MIRAGAFESCFVFAMFLATEPGQGAKTWARGGGEIGKNNNFLKLKWTGGVGRLLGGAFTLQSRNFRFAI